MRTHHPEHAGELAPHYCPRCRHTPVVGEHPLCPECGERLVPQGYCGVCRDHWTLAAGTNCPKHDIPLESAPDPPTAPFDIGDGPITWETVATYNHPGAAQAPRIRLEAEGIPTFLDGERMASHGLHHPAAGGVRLRVPRSLAGEARIILDQSWAPIPSDDDLGDWDWDEEGGGPEPWTVRREIMRAILVLILLLPVIVALLQDLQR